MPIVSIREILNRAFKDRYAVGQFNVNSLEFIQAFLQAAQEERSPIILGITEGALHYMGGFRMVASMVRMLFEEYQVSVPVAVHFDHSTSLRHCLQAMEAGFTSVMIDGSHLSLTENINLARKVVDAARKYGVSVEAELGRISGQEDDVVIHESQASHAIPEECQRFVSETNVNCLAPSIGTVHGPFKGEPNLKFDVLERIRDLTGTPLALHGGTGVPAEDIKRAIALGITKINVNTENQILFADTVRKILSDKSGLYDLRKYLGPAREAIKQSVKEKIREFGSSGKAIIR
jgi:fructose-bisphosphate aldolase class II